MPDYAAPEGWKLYGTEKDQTTFIMPGHTASEPRLAIFTRRAVSSNGSNGSANPSYRVRIIRGFLDAEGVALPRAVVDAEIRWPSAAPAADIYAIIAAAGVILSNVDFQQDAVVEQLLPTTVTPSA